MGENIQWIWKNPPNLEKREFSFNKQGLTTYLHYVQQTRFGLFIFLMTEMVKKEIIGKMIKRKYKENKIKRGI